MNNQNRSWMLLAGLLGVAVGLMEIYVEQSMTLLSLALCVMGLIVLVLVLLKNRNSFKPFNLAQCKKGVLVVLAAVFFFSLWLGINYVSLMLPWRWDVTQAQQHTLSKNTLDLIKNLKKDITLTALLVGIPPKYLEDLFKEYTKVSQGRIKVEIIDPIQQLSYAAQFGNVINAQERKVIVSSGVQKKEILFTDSALSEGQVTNAIALVDQKRRYAYFLIGHGELSIENKDNQGLSRLSQALDSYNLESRNLMLGIEKKIPQDCSVLVIAGPKNNLTKEENDTIEAYLEKGGRALFLIENVTVTTPDKPLSLEDLHKNPSLNEILHLWGLHVEEDVVVDLANHVGQDVGSPATKNYIKHPSITGGVDYTFYVRPRSISVLKDVRSTIKHAPIVLTESKEQSWGETNRTLQVHFDEIEDTPGPVPISYVVGEDKTEGDLADTRLIVFTDADFLSNAYINQYSNFQLGVNVINWLSQTDSNIVIRQKNINVERLDLTSKQKRMVAAILFFMPVLIALIGIKIWMKGM